ncbi:hypothetical protein MNBD_GAMMA12-3635 [hydrothermal vent metagenome]|uniref:histidine kinase n=1 Tax=hydrothermal vent metagenome TaxID=652676 RepID=A0A3B0YD39_9ZZZZ
MPKLFNSLGVKFVTLVVIILLLTLGFTSYRVIQSQKQLMTEALDEKVKMLGRFAALVSPESIISYDFSALNRTMKDLTAQKDMVYSLVLSKNFKALSSYVNHEDPFVIDALKKLKIKVVRTSDWKYIIVELRKNAELNHYIFPVRFDGEELGRIYLGISRQRVDLLINSVFFEQVVSAGSIILFLSLCIYLAFKVNTLRPIEKLMQGSVLIASGKLASEIEVTSKDELGLLTVSFNDMMSKLRMSNKIKDKISNELIQLNRTLEDRVRKRTEQLADSEERTRTILNTVGEGIITVNEAGLIVSANKAVESAFKSNKNEIIGAHSTKLLADKSWYQASLNQNYEDKREGPFKLNESKKLTEYEGLRANQQSFILETLVTQVTLKGESMRIVVLRDISYRKELESRLSEAAHKSGMADLATGVLHNIGNILNSVNVSGEEILRIIRSSKVSGLVKANALLQENIDNVAEYLGSDPKGRLLPGYYLKLGEQLQVESSAIIEETQSLSDRITMMREVIDSQQTYARAGGYTEPMDLPVLIADSVRVLQSNFEQNNVQVIKDFEQVPQCHVQKSKLSQVITNLVKNSVEAMERNDEFNRIKELKITLTRLNDDEVQLTIADNGRGISNDNLVNVFSHGFTTKKTGHGFGLHTCANSMTEMKGSIRVESEGLEQGATFVLVIPIGTQQTVKVEQTRVA